MRVDGKPYRTIWLAPDGWSVEIIDQTRLPHEFATTRLTTRKKPRTRSVPCWSAARR